ncbi:MAG: porin family protein [bacterium]|nr:porin family protein [bacterium]
MKKALSLVVLATTAATIASADARNFGGATLGLSVGHGSTKAEASIQTGQLDPSLTHVKVDAGMSGFTVGIFAGYAKQFDNHFVAGLEAHASFASHDAKSNDGVLATTEFKIAKRKETFGVDAKFGRVFENVLPYVTLGWGSTKFKFKRASGNAENTSTTKRSNAFVAGVGIKTLLTEHVTLGAEWKYGFCKEIKVADSKMKPRTSDFRVKLAYKW